LAYANESRQLLLQLGCTLLAAHLSLHLGDTAEARSYLRIAARLARTSVAARSLFIEDVALLQFTLGRTAAAERLHRQQRVPTTKTGAVLQLCTHVLNRLVGRSRATGHSPMRAAQLPAVLALRRALARVLRLWRRSDSSV